MSEDATERVVAVNRGVERSEKAGPSRGEPHRALEAWIGRWINQGHTLDERGNADLPITTSDVYEWAPGGFFVLHTAYGRIGTFDGGAVELIGYDDATGEYVSNLFDSGATTRPIASWPTATPGPTTAPRRERPSCSAMATRCRPCSTNAPTTVRRSCRRCT